MQKVKTSDERPDIRVTNAIGDGGRCHLYSVFTHRIETHHPLACFEFRSHWGQKQYFKTHMFSTFGTKSILFFIIS